MADAICDTSVIIDLLNGRPDSLQWYATLGRTRIAITPIVWMEVVNGTNNKRDFTRALRFLRKFPIEHPIANDYFWVMHQFAQYHLSHHIDMQDVMIASVAVRLQIPVYTLNLKHFSPLPDIKVIRPY